MERESILEWFDVYEPTHIDAFKELQRTGMWPVGFIPENIDFPNAWQIGLYGLLAEAYLAQFE